MNKQTSVLIVFLASTTLGQNLWAQTSSLGAKKRKSDSGKVIPPPSREAQLIERNLVYEQHSWTASRPQLPKTFQPGDLITIIVRERRSFEVEADLERKRRWKVKSELDAFLKGTAGGIGAAAFRRGKPTIDYKFTNKLEGDGELEREDRFTTRLTATIIDIKPNGNLVIEGRGALQFDDEVSVITITGVCRQDDMTPDNTILSTQMAELNVIVNNEGALRRASSRGWIPRMLDWLRPI
ncbi:MAG: flagellar basal body L-ring protein FlgH [Planctomycetes bacterium]|nr:flagellar basal body L-ring protein FlgH [Planctomycetota bacterium]